MDNANPWITLERPRSRLGKTVVVLESCDSTNTIALDLARSGCQDGTVVIAKHQTKGRGRLGRVWESWPGNLALSIVVRPNLAIRSAHRLVFASACATASALCSVGIDAHIKWPNDLLMLPKESSKIEKLGLYRKIGGILLELTSTEQKIESAVIGIGLNVLRPPLELPHIAIPQMGFIEDQEPARKIDLSAFTHTLLNKLEVRLEDIFSDAGFDKILSAFEERCAFKGQAVQVACGDKIVSGILRGPSSDGGLIIDAANSKAQCIYFGDVSLV